MIKNYMQSSLRALDLSTLHLLNLLQKGQATRPFADRLTGLINVVNILDSDTKLPIDVTGPRNLCPCCQSTSRC